MWYTAERSTKTFKQYSGRNLSSNDAVSIEIMNEFDIEKYLGFDAHFNGIVEQVPQRTTVDCEKIGNGKSKFKMKTMKRGID